MKKRPLGWTRSRSLAGSDRLRDVDPIDLTHYHLPGARDAADDLDQFDCPLAQHTKRHAHHLAKEQYCGGGGQSQQPCHPQQRPGVRVVQSAAQGNVNRAVDAGLAFSWTDTTALVPAATVNAPLARSALSAGASATSCF